MEHSVSNNIIITVCRCTVCKPLWLLSFLQRIGYLAASQCFHESTDVIMLTTNQIRKVSCAHDLLAL